MAKKYAIPPLIATTALLLFSNISQATTTHLCSGSSSTCEIPATSFSFGTGSSGVSLIGNPSGDTLIIDSGQIANVPNQTYASFGDIKNYGTLVNGDPVLNNYPFFRVLGTGAKLDNHGTFNNFSDIYVQDSSVYGTNASSGVGTLHTRNGSVLNNGSSSTYSSGEYYYGAISLYDGASMINDGTLNNYSQIFVDNTSSFTNNGSFINYAPSDTSFGSPVLLDGLTTNTGTIHNKPGAAMATGVFHNTWTGKLISEGVLESFIFNATSNGTFTNAGEVEITSTGTGPEPGFYAPGTFIQTSGSLTVDGEFVQSYFDIQGGIVTGGGTLDTTKSAVSGTAPTVYIGPSSILSPGNGVDNEMVIIGDVELDGELIIELFDDGYDVLHIVADSEFGSSTGYLNLGGLLTIDLVNGFSANVGDTFDIITTEGGLLNDFILDAIFEVDGYTFERTLLSNKVRLSVVSAVPIPASLLLFISGLTMLTGMRRLNK